MSDALKDFIMDNRAGFDDLEPGDLWSKIDTTLKQNPSSFNLKNIPDMFKYGFGASVLVAGTFLLVNLQKENVNALHQTIRQVRVDSQLPAFKTPKLNAGAILLTEIKTNKKESPAEINDESEAGSPSFAAQVKEILFADTSAAKSTPASAVKAPFMVAKALPPDSLKESAYTGVDTLFNGVKRIEVNVDFCDVTVRGGSSSQVSVHGKISESAGSFIVLGRRAFKKTEYSLRFEKKDSVLKVWTECKKVNERVASKDINSDRSVLDFNVPLRTSVVVDNHSGNVVVSGLESKQVVLNTSFGNITAENVISDLALKSSSGNITLNNITGEIKAENSFGNQFMENIKGNVRLRSSSGNTTIKELRGNADLNSSFGFQKLEGITGNIISNVSSGNISIKHLRGDASANSSFGKQAFEDVEGDVNARASSGDIKISALKGKLSAGTSFGDISGKDITLVSSGDFKTSSGDIRICLLNEMKDLSFDLRSSSGDLLVEKNDIKGSSDEKLVIGKGPILVKGVSSFGDQVYK